MSCILDFYEDGKRGAAIMVQTGNIARELKKYRILFDLATAMTGDQPLAENLRMVVEMSRTLLATDLAFLALRDDARQELYVASHSRVRTEALRRMRTPLNQGLGGWVATTGQGRIVREFRSDPNFVADPAGLAEGLVSGLATPIQLDRKSFGVLFAFNTTATAFSADDLDSLMKAGNIAAVEIERRQIEDRLRDSEQKYRLLMDAVPDPVIVFDRKGRVTYLNSVFSRTFGWRLDEVKGSPLDFIPEESRAESLQALERMRRGDVAIALETRRTTKSGRTLDIQGSISQFKDPKGRFVGSIVLLRDVTEIKNTEKALRESNHRLAAAVREQKNRARELEILNSMNEWLQACCNEADTYKVMARICRQLFPGDAGFLGMRDEASNRFAAVSSWGDDTLKDIDYDENDCWSLRLGKMHALEDLASDLSCSHPIGENTHSYLCLPITSSAGVLGVLHVFFKAPVDGNSIGETRQNQTSKLMILNTMLEHYSLSLLNLRLHKTLKNQSIRDPLTSLFNRRYLDESLRREMFRCKRHGASTGLIMMDIDHFKAYNDTYGHEVGDVILKELAVFLKSHTRDEDILCRFGGEEFILLMPDTNLAIALRRAEQLCALVRDTLRVTHQGITHQLTLSMGTAAFPESGSTIEAAQNAADAALYEAKRLGRDRVMAASG
jgi:diguanylate cyclase (GGDEF)-like protein/PAS domain S-box-containing protein